MQCDGSGLVLNGQKLPASVMMAPYGGGLNYVRDRSYRGQIQFICQGNTVLAVNHIDMLNYLYSVVGSEVSASWPTAALQAQSVAARSYALTYYFRPAKEHFHIGDTESYQVYKGTISEDSRVKSAVNSTAGEFISYQGGIVESLYAASDDIVMEAFQGGGMSQLGALDFAEQGYNYLQILGYYYPQTSLGRMVIDGQS
jgi:stage II sporulation protein D